MAVEHDEANDPELGNGDTLSERIEKLDLEADETCSADELRQRFDL